MARCTGVYPLAEMRAAAPQAIGPYRVLGIIGEGGMGVVYRAEHAVTGEVVALKTVRVPHESHLAGIRREIHALRRLRHPGVVRIVDEGVDRNLPWYAMELLEGRTLADVIRATWRASQPAGETNVATREAGHETMLGGLTAPPPAEPAENAPTAVSTQDSESEPPFFPGRAVARSITLTREGELPRRPAGGGRLRSALSLLRGLCETLAYLHGEGVVHRDLKPANVIIRADDTPVLMDFGLVWRFPGSAGREVLEVSRALAGTPAYMAPEQIRGELADARTDLYAVGCMLYEVVTGRVPFAESTLVLQAKLSGDPESPTRYVDDVPPALEALISKLLQRRPRDRIGHASDVAGALAALGADERPMYPVKPRAYVYRPELTGRADPLKKLDEHLERLSMGKGGVALVGGESGIGKTYLAMTFARAATERGARVIVASCVAPSARAASTREGEEWMSAGAPESIAAGAPGRGPTDAPLHPFLPLLQNIADHCMERGADFTASLLGDGAKVLAACEPSLARLPGHDDFPDPPELPAQAARERLLRALASTLGALAEEHALLLILDDLQWADDLSLEFLASLPEAWLAEHRVLILGTYRAEDVGPLLQRLLDRPYVGRIDLGRIDEAGVGSMVADMLALPAPPAEFARFLAERSNGNPFFVAEWVRTAVDAGLLTRTSSGQWEIAEAGPAAVAYESLPLPGSLRALVGRRLDGLAAPARALTDIASVIGREIDADLLSRVAASLWAGRAPGADIEAPSRREPGLEYVIMGAVRELVARQVLEETEPGKLSFLHDKLREIAYQRISKEGRRALHKATAEAIEAASAGTAAFSLLHAKLAHHYLRAGDDRRAIAYLDKAADQAIKNFANRDAVGFLGDLLSLEERVGAGKDARGRVRLARRERQLADAHYALGDMAATVEHAARALRWAGLSAPTSSGGWAKSLLAGIPAQIAHRLAPRAFVARGEEERELHREAALAMQRLSQRFYFLDAVAMVAGSLWAVNLAERAGGDVQVATPYGMLGMTLGIGHLPALSRRYFALARAAAAETGDDDGLVMSLYAEATCLSGEGAFPAARALLARALEVSAQTGNRAERETVETVIANADHLTGRFGEAKRAFLSLIRSARESGNQQHLAWGLYGAARSMIPLGEVDAAIPLLEEARAALATQEELPSKIITLGLLASAYLRRGDLDRATRAADEASARIRENRLIAYAIVTGYAGVAEVYEARWEKTGQGRPASARAVRDLRVLALALPVAAPCYHRFDGRLRAVDGDARGARAAWERGLAIAERLEMPWDEATLRLHLARLAPGSAPARAHLERARALFGEMGCPQELGEIDQLLGRSAGSRVQPHPR